MSHNNYFQWTRVQGGRHGNSTTHRPHTNIYVRPTPPVLDRALSATHRGRSLTQNFTQPVPAGRPGRTYQRSYAQALMGEIPNDPSQGGLPHYSPLPQRSQPRRRQPNFRFPHDAVPQPENVPNVRNVHYLPVEQPQDWDRAPADLARVSRHFFKIMKVIHHGSNISPFQNPPKTIANLTYLLSSTIRPACPNPLITDLVWGSAKQWEFSVMLALRQHYEDTLEVLLSELAYQDVEIWEEAFRLAETWMRKRFKRVREDVFRTTGAKLQHAFDTADIPLTPCTGPQRPVEPVQVASPQQEHPAAAAAAAPPLPRRSSETRASTSGLLVVAPPSLHPDGGDPALPVPPSQPAPPSPLLLFSDPVRVSGVGVVQSHPSEIPLPPVSGPSHPQHPPNPCCKPITTPQRHDTSSIRSLPPSLGGALSHSPVVLPSPTSGPTHPHTPSDSSRNPVTTLQRHDTSITLALSPLQEQALEDAGNSRVPALSRSPPHSPPSVDSVGPLGPQSSPHSDTLTDLIQLIDEDSSLTPSITKRSNQTGDSQLELSQEDLEELLRDEPSAVFTPTVHPHTVNKLLDWSLTVRKPILMIGDSNLARFPYHFNKNIQVDSYPGASFVHAQSLLDRAVIHCKKIEKIIISFGINSRSQRSTVTTQQIDTLIRAMNKKFPKTEIWIPLINFSEHLPPHEKDTLEKINTHLRHTSVQILPLLDNFSTASDQVHWHNRTAKHIWSHWLACLNL